MVRGQNIQITRSEEAKVKLFEPITIGGMQLKNRIVMPAIGNFTYSLAIKEKKQRVIAYYAERAKGGAGSIILGAALPSYFLPERDLGQPQDVTGYLEAIAELVEAVHKYGAKMGIQLFHANSYPSGSPISRGPEWVAPSSRVEPAQYGLTYIPPGQVLRELTTAEVESIIATFAAAASRVKETGADFIELHLAHGHMPGQFFSPIDNRRRDKYGGDLFGRMRFAIECIEGMRAAVSREYPLFCRLGARDNQPGGVVLEDSIIFARELEKAGADCFNVSVGAGGDRSYQSHTSPLKKNPMGTFAPLAEAIKTKVKVPVVAVGRINTPEVAEDILTKGQADLVALCRQLMCDPYWPEKAAQGRVEEIIACESCNINCLAQGKNIGPHSFLCRRNEREGERRGDLLPI